MSIIIILRIDKISWSHIMMMRSEMEYFYEIMQPGTSLHQTILLLLYNQEKMNMGMS